MCTAICSSPMYRRVSPVDLLDLPFNLVHEMFRSSFIASEAEKERQQKDEEKRRREEAYERSRQRTRPAGNRSTRYPVQESPTPSMDLSGIEELIEEGI